MEVSVCFVQPRQFLPLLAKFKFTCTTNYAAEIKQWYTSYVLKDMRNKRRMRAQHRQI